jgi:hypothetical protein
MFNVEQIKKLYKNILTLHFGKRVAVLITLFIAVFSILWGGTKDLRNRLFVKERIYDFFSRTPNKDMPVNVGVFDLFNDNTIGGNLPIQNLFAISYSTVGVSFYKRYTPIEYAGNDTSQIISTANEYANKYDVVVWGTSLLRDGNMNYRLFIVAGNKLFYANDFKLIDGKFPVDCDKAMSLAISHVLLNKIISEYLFDVDHYDRKLLLQYYKSIMSLLNRSETLLDEKDRIALLIDAAEILVQIENTECLSMDVIEITKRIDSLLKGNTTNLPNLPISLSRLYYMIGKAEIDNNYYSAGIRHLEIADSIISQTIISLKKTKEHWKGIADGFSEFMAQDIELSLDEYDDLVIRHHSIDKNDDRMKISLPVIDYEYMSYLYRKACYLKTHVLYQQALLENDEGAFDSLLAYADIYNKELFRKHYFEVFNFSTQANLNEFNEFTDLLFMLIESSYYGPKIENLIMKEKEVLKNLGPDKTVTRSIINCDLSKASLFLGSIEGDPEILLKGLSANARAKTIFKSTDHKRLYIESLEIAADLYQVLYLMSKGTSKTNSSYLREENKIYRSLIEIGISSGLAWKYSNYMLDFAISNLMLYADDGDIKKAMQATKVFFEYSEAMGDVTFFNDDGPVYDCAKGINLALLYRITKDYKYLSNAISLLTNAHNGFSKYIDKNDIYVINSALSMLYSLKFDRTNNIGDSLLSIRYSKENFWSSNQARIRLINPIIRKGYDSLFVSQTGYNMANIVPSTVP